MVTSKSQVEIKAHRNEWVKLIADHPDCGGEKISRRLSSGGRIYVVISQRLSMVNAPLPEKEG